MARFRIINLGPGRNVPHGAHWDHRVQVQRKVWYGWVNVRGMLYSDGGEADLARLIKRATAIIEQETKYGFVLFDTKDVDNNVHHLPDAEAGSRQA